MKKKMNKKSNNDADSETPRANEEAETNISHSKDESNVKPSGLMDLLKNNLSCEMYHALLEVFNSKHYIIKIHLTVFLLISYALASYMTIELVINYFNYGVTTSIRTIYETPAVFPQITFCNLNQFTTKEAYEFLNSTDTDRLLSQMENVDYYDRSELLWKLFFKAQGILANKTDDFKKKMGHDLKDILFLCKFNFQKCTANDFIWTWNNNFGNCFTFNSGYNSTPLRKSDVSSINYGLEVDLFVNFYENLSFTNSLCQGQGVMVFIDNVTHVVEQAFDGISVSAGMATKIALKREFKTMLPKPYSDCLIDQGKDTVHDSYLYNLIKNSPYDYTQYFCIEQCLQQLVIEKCKCYFSAFESLIDSDICTTLNQTTCATQTYLNIYGKNNYPKNVCLPQCPLECNSTQILFKTTTYELLGDSYVDLIQKNKNLSSYFLNKTITPDVAKKSVSRIFVYYDSLSYIQSDEAPQIDFISLIANIGGNLGLFLGVSLFSVWEIVITLLEIYFYKKQQKIQVN
jgi:hypothetical protein